MKYFWLALVLLACAAIIGVGIAAPQRIDTVYMTAESDGRRQDDHKFFGFIPYSTARMDPNLNVTRDALAAIRESGLRNLPDAVKPNPTFGPIRVHHGPRTFYSLGFDLKKTSAKDALDFYARQLKKPTRAPTMVMGTCPDGKATFSFSVSKGPHGDMGHLTISP